MWTHFYDMHSGGNSKLAWEHILIEGVKDDAIERFTQLFDRHPCSVSCYCCGEDYAIDEADMPLKAVSYFLRGRSLKQAIQDGQVLLVVGD